LNVQEKEDFKCVEENGAIFVVLCEWGGVKPLRVEIAMRRRKLHSKSEHKKMKTETGEVPCGDSAYRIMSPVGDGFEFHSSVWTLFNVFRNETEWTISGTSQENAKQF
jgi:hypothetical protein